MQEAVQLCPVRLSSLGIRLVSLARFHVFPHADQWRVVRVGELFRGPYRTKDEAIRAAQLLALLDEPSEVLIHDSAGNVEGEATYRS